MRSQTRITLVLLIVVVLTTIIHSATIAAGDSQRDISPAQQRPVPKPPQKPKHLFAKGISGDGRFVFAGRFLSADEEKIVYLDGPKRGETKWSELSKVQ